MVTEKGKGWRKESKRHSLASKGIKTTKIKGKDYYLIPKNITNKQWLHGDFDNDGVKNKDDCYPLDPKRHMSWDMEAAEREGAPIEYMTPDEYLRKTGMERKNNPDYYDKYFEKYYDSEENKSRDIKHLGELIDDPNKKVFLPNVGDSPSDHEGRHRAYAAKQRGHKTIPVMTSIKGTKEERRELGKKFTKEMGIDKDLSYREEWLGRFERGCPYYSMDSKSKKVFKKIMKEEEENRAHPK